MLWAIQSNLLTNHKKDHRRSRTIPSGKTFKATAVFIGVANKNKSTGAREDSLRHFLDGSPTFIGNLWKSDFHRSECFAGKRSGEVFFCMASIYQIRIRAHVILFRTPADSFLPARFPIVFVLVLLLTAQLFLGTAPLQIQAPQLLLLGAAAL